MIYLDNNATTMLDPRVRDIYFDLLQQRLGNPSSMHRYGQKARYLLIEARKRIADFFQISPKYLVMTSGATEALTTAILSCPPRTHVITSSLEHLAVREAVQQTQCDVTWLNPETGRGAITVQQIEQALRPSTKMIVITAANNETGICTDLYPIAECAQQHDLMLVIDAVAYIGKEPWHMLPGKVAVCASGHKIHAPLGVGCIAYHSGFPLRALFSGGGQQNALRAGTESVALAAAFAHALEILQPEYYQTMRRLRDTFEHDLKTHVKDILIHGEHERRVSNVSNIAFPNCEGETLLMKLDLADVAASHGSACQSGALEPSHVLTNMGLERDVIRRSLRFSLSRMTTQEEISRAVDLIVRALS